MLNQCCLAIWECLYLNPNIYLIQIYYILYIIYNPIYLPVWWDKVIEITVHFKEIANILFSICGLLCVVT